MDTAAFGAPRVENPAKCGDLDVEIAVLDDGLRPDDGNNFGPRDELARPLDQRGEYVERALTDRQWSENAALIPSQQDADAAVETELLEEEDVHR